MGGQRNVNQLRALLTGIVASAIPDDETALLLSGGVDSLSVGFAAMLAGKRVAAYTFQIGERETEDSRAARAAAERMGWPWTLVKVPTENLEAEFLELARRWRCEKKTQFECTWPFLHLAPVVRERFVLSGVAADGHFGLSRRANQHYRHTKELFDQFRTEYFGHYNPAGSFQLKRVFAARGRRVVAPYLERAVFSHFMQFDHPTLNQPIQKFPIVEAFRPEFARARVVRRHANLQLVAGVPEIFETLLRSKLNTRGRSRVLDLCRDYAL